MKICMMMFLLLFSRSSFAVVCGPDSSAQWANQLNESFFENDQMLGSCAAQAQLSKTNWKNELESKVDQFLKDPSHSTQIQSAYESEMVMNKLSSQNPSQKQRLFKNEFMKSLNDQLRAPDTRQKVLNMARGKDCVKGVDLKFGPDVGYFSEDFFVESMTNGKKRYQYPNLKGALEYSATWDPRAETDGVALQKLKKQVEEEKSSDVENFTTICSSEVPMRSGLLPVVYEEQLDLTRESFFDDNSSAIKPTQEKLIQQHLSKALQPSAPGCKKSVRSVQIATSANGVRNTKGVGSWDFQTLSDRRAQSLKGVVKKLLGNSVSDQDIVMGFEGENGDGTSGPCPYYAKTDTNGKIAIARITSANFAEAKANGAVSDRWKSFGDFSQSVEKGKFGRVTFEVEEECAGRKVKADEHVHGYFASKCFSVTASCQK